MMITMAAAVAVTGCFAGDSGNGNNPVSTTTTTSATTAATAVNGLSFTGKVLEIDGDNVLMNCYDKTKFDTVWVNVSAASVTPAVGEEYTVFYEDFMMPSLPPRITAVAVEKN